MDYRPDRSLFPVLLWILLWGGLGGRGRAQQITDQEVPPLESPEVLADRSVVFRFDAPSADHVKLRGIKRTLLDLTKSKEGIWSIKLDPLDPGIYEYSFIVDGEPVLDPSNPLIKPEITPDSSLLEITSGTPQFYQWKDVPHGTIHLHDYLSESLKRLRRLRVYTPPTYESAPEEHFPVLYLFHGTGDTEATWTEFGHAHLILDNLLAEHKVLPMIVVMPDGHADLQEEEGIHKANFLRFSQDLIESVLPLVARKYRTEETSSGRAVCGLSMGGMQALQIGLNHADTFGYVGAMSAYVPNAEDLIAPALADPALNEKLRLLWGSIGRDDYLLKPTEDFNALLQTKGIHQQFYLTPGTHDWTVWRGYLRDFTPLLFH